MSINRLVKSEEALRDCLKILGLDVSYLKRNSVILAIVPYNHITLISDGEELYDKKDIKAVEELAELILPIFMPELTLTRITGLTVRFTSNSPVEISVSRYGATND